MSFISFSLYIGAYASKYCTTSSLVILLSINSHCVLLGRNDVLISVPCSGVARFPAVAIRHLSRHLSTSAAAAAAAAMAENVIFRNIGFLVFLK